MTTESAQLTTRLDRWVGQGLITREQADRILAAESEGMPTRSGPSLVTEALGYVGGVLVLVAAATITGRLWSELGTGGRIGVAFGAAALLFVAGTAAPAGSVGGRLRSVSWLLSTALLAGGIALIGDDVLAAPGDAITLLTAGLTAVYAALLWRAHRWVLQHAALVAALAVAAGAAAALLPRGGEEVVGLAIWGVGVAWLLLGLGAVVAARTVACVCGGVAVVAGPMFTVQHDWGSVLALASAFLLVTAGVVLRDLVLLGVGAVATLVAVPVVLSRYFPDTLATAFALLAVGALLVVGALYTERRRPGGPGRERVLHPREATIAAGAVVVGTVAAVLILGI